MTQYLSLAKAASRMGADASTVGKWARRGLIVKRATARRKAVRIKLASWLVLKGGRIRRLTTALAVRRFNAQRGAR